MNALAVRDQNPAILLTPTTQELQVLRTLAQEAVSSGLLPSTIKNDKQALIIALKGREMGIPMMAAWSDIYVVNGKPTCAATLMHAQILRLVPGAKIHIVKTNRDICIIRASRPGSEETEFTYDTEDARLAGLLEKDNWKKHPRGMRRSRCVSEMARSMFPDALMGVQYTPEEINADLPVNEDGEVIDITPPNKGNSTPPPQIESTKPPMDAERFARLGKCRAPVLIGPIKKDQMLEQTPRQDMEKVMVNFKDKDLPPGQIGVFIQNLQDYAMWIDETMSELSDDPREESLQQ